MDVATSYKVVVIQIVGDLHEMVGKGSLAEVIVDFAHRDVLLQHATDVVFV